MNLPHAHAVFVHGDGPAHRLPGVVKVVALVVVVLAVMATPREQVWALVMEAGLVATGAVACRISASVFFRRMTLATPFLLVALTLPFVGGRPFVTVGGVDVSIDGVWAAWTITAKGGTCLAASVVVTATTTVSGLVEALSRLRVPALLVSVASFMVRYLDVLAAEAARLRTAMAARGYAPRWLWHAAPAASAASGLFVRSYERGERIYDAMMARGYTGTMPRLDAAPLRIRDWSVGMALPAVAVLVATAALGRGAVS